MPEFQIDKKIKDKIIITNPSELVDKPTDNFPFTRAEKVKLAELGSGSGGNQIYIGELPPTDPNVLLWIDTSEPVLSDVDILRVIRDANPQSTQLAGLFDDTKDPHTEWRDDENSLLVLFGDSPDIATISNNFGLSLPSVLNPNKVYILNIGSANIINLDLSGLSELVFAFFPDNKINNVIIKESNKIQKYMLLSNLLTSINIVDKGIITYFGIQNNNLPQTEIDRLVALGFDINNILPQNVQS